MVSQKDKTAIFIMPRASSAWRGAEALWITAAGLSMAAKKKLGNAVVLTNDRIAEPHEVLNYPLRSGSPNGPGPGKPSYMSRLPNFFKIFIKDLLLWTKNKSKYKNNIDFTGASVQFIWEQHDLFAGPGKHLSRKFKVPFVKYVHAPVVWEAEKWGVHRYWWGRFLEHMEMRNLSKADLIAVVSKGVREKLVQKGIPPQKIMISPMAVDPDFFQIPPEQKGTIQLSKELRNKFVLGWTGSFRDFHGLEDVVQAFDQFQAIVPDSALVLVGDGSQRIKIEELVKKLNIEDKVFFVGKKKFLEIPVYLELFDVAVVSAKKAEDFHYSPLKLREYMAAGKAILAPSAGEIKSIFHDEYHLKLFTVGDISSLQNGMLYLFRNEERREEIAANGRREILNSGTWEGEMDRMLDRLKTLKNDRAFKGRN